MKKLLIVLLGILLVGCSSDEPGGGGTVGNGEVITEPVKPSGPAVVAAGVQQSFVTGGASSSIGDPVEYQFDFDAGGAHDFSGWGSSQVISKSWASDGLRVIKVRARCQIHNTAISDWSLGKAVEVGSGPETEITSVVNTYFKMGAAQTRPIDFADGVPDTVPYGSWITVFYDGTPTSQADSLCGDETNECLRYQARYIWESVRNPGVQNEIAWRPFDPEDTNPNGVTDSTTMNIGSVEYTFLARSVDQFDRPDVTPAQIEIIGNFSPTIDGLGLSDQSGNTVDPGDTITWDWWHPANLGASPTDTIDVNNGNIIKKFHFVVRATGHDHPLEQDGSGVKAWKYTFLEVGSSPPTFVNFGRSGVFVDGTTVNVLADTAEVVFRYNPVTDPGGFNTLATQGGFLDKEYEYTVMGRDLSILDVFEQKMFYSGGLVLLNAYNSAEYGKWTGELQQRFYLKLIR